MKMEIVGRETRNQIKCNYYNEYYNHSPNSNIDNTQYNFASHPQLIKNKRQEQLEDCNDSTNYYQPNQEIFKPC
jgi:hypothetical protein